MMGGQRRRLVLIVEDSQSMLGLLGRLLEDSTLQVALAPDADTAWGMAQARTPDLAIIDYFLPGGKNGADLAAALAPVPVLGLTGRPDREVYRAFERAGVLRVLEKPLDVIALVGLVDDLTGG